MKIPKPLCAYCTKKAMSFLEGVPLCPEHLVKEYYAKNPSCLESFLMSLAERRWEGEELTREEKAFLQEVERVFPAMRSEFPILFHREEKSLRENEKDRRRVLSGNDRGYGKKSGKEKGNTHSS